VVVILFIFGGDGIRNFAFALSVGIFFGTYSSIFIAAPILVDTVKDADALVEEEEPVLELPVVEEGEEQNPQA
jgi:SecD/SecF fusion protein